MDSYCDIFVPETRRKSKRRKTTTTNKHVTKPKRQYLPVRGFTEDFTVASQRGISHSPDSVVDLNLTQFSQDREYTQEITKTNNKIFPCNPAVNVQEKVRWADVVKYGIEFAEWEHIDETIFVLEM